MTPRAREWAVSFAFVAAMFALIFVAPGGGFGASYEQPPRKCMSRAAWSGNDNKRPCVRILRVYEDGSSTQRIERANGRELWSGDVGVPW